MTDEPREPGATPSDDEKELAEEKVAAAIEEAVGDAPASIEEEELAEAAALEEAQHPPKPADRAPEPAAPLPEDSTLAALATRFPGVRFERFEPLGGPGQDIALVDRENYAGLVAAVKEAGYEWFIDLCAVDYLRRRPRYEVVLTVLSMAMHRRLRIRVGIPHDDPSVASVAAIYPGANFYEREAFDLFGIRFDGHPDLTRILLPDDWEGYPLRKDYAVGSVPVQFKEAHKAT